MGAVAHGRRLDGGGAVQTPVSYTHLKKSEEIRVVTSGAGAAGIAIIRLLIAMGLKDVVLCDRQGAIYKGREGLNAEKTEMAEITNQECRKGTLAEVLKGADVFIGVSAPGCVTPEMVKSMAPNPILFPLSLIHIWYTRWRRPHYRRPKR